MTWVSKRGPFKASAQHRLRRTLASGAWQTRVRAQVTR